MTDESAILKQRYDEIALTLDDTTTACDFHLRDLEIALGLESIRDGEDPERDDPPPATITHALYKDGIEGLEGGLRRHLQHQIETLAPGDVEEQSAVWDLLSLLSLRQVDGTMTTGLVREEDLARHWQGGTPFAAMIEKAESLRLVRVSTRSLGATTEERGVFFVHEQLRRALTADLTGT